MKLLILIVCSILSLVSIAEDGVISDTKGRPAEESELFIAGGAGLGQSFTSKGGLNAANLRLQATQGHAMFEGEMTLIEVKESAKIQNADAYVAIRFSKKNHFNLAVRGGVQLSKFQDSAEYIRTTLIPQIGIQYVIGQETDFFGLEGSVFVIPLELLTLTSENATTAESVIAMPGIDANIKLIFNKRGLHQFFIKAGLEQIGTRANSASKRKILNTELSLGYFFKPIGFQMGLEGKCDTLSFIEAYSTNENKMCYAGVGIEFHL